MQHGDLPHSEGQPKGKANAATLLTFGALFLPIAATLILVLSFLYKQEAMAWRAVLEEREINQLRVEEQVLTKDFRSIASDLLFLADQFTEHLQQRGNAKGHFFEEEILLFANSKRFYDQIRFIDNTGRESMRVNYAPGHSYLVPEDELQSKKDRYYFKSAIALEANQIYVSPFDLNMEKGIVEQPHKPMIRFCTPLFGPTGEKRGVLVLNYLGADLLKDFKNVYVDSPGEIMLLNGKGFWLQGREKSGQNWGFMFPEGRGWTMAAESPAAWERLSSQERGQFYDGLGLFSFLTIDPAKEINRLTVLSIGAEAVPENLAPNASSWKVVSFVENSYLQTHKRRLRNRFLSIGGSFLFFALAGCLFWARAAVARKNSQEQVIATNTRLDQLVTILEKQNFEIALINKVSDFLQSCKTLEESFPVIAKYGRQLFPDASGALYMVHSENQDLEKKASWGKNDTGILYFEQDDCWALRRGKVHAGEADPFEMTCKHFSTPPSSGHLCLPMMAHGKLLGLLSLQPAPGKGGKEAHKALKYLAEDFVEHITLVLANISLRERLHNQSIRDPLTGLFNRRYMEESFLRELARAQRHTTPIGIIMLDVDHFKRFNDTHGHEAGDLVLQELGTLLLHETRKDDIACRFGGEEFVVILPGASLEQASKRAERLRKAVEERLHLQHQGEALPPVAISLGVSAFPANGQRMGLLLEAADQALYQAKDAGRNRVMLAGASPAGQ